MKKILSCLIVALLVIMALASCTISGGSNPTTTEPTAPAVDPMEQAKSFLYALYKDEATTTPADIIRLNTISVGGVQYSVEWSVEVTQGEASDVVIEAGDQSYEVRINVNEKTNVEVKYVLTATISDAEGNTISVSFAEYTVPAFGVKSWDEYIAAGEGDSLVVQGVVTAIFCKSQGASYNGMYLQDENGGYYIYSMANDVDPLVAGVKVGMTVQVAGLKTIYSGTHEVKEATVEIINEEISEVVVHDYTEIFKNASSLTDPALAGKQAQLVTIKGVTVLAQDADATTNNYYKFQMGDLITYVRVSGSVCPIPKAEQAGFIAAHGEHTGWIADVTGVISVYDGRFYLTPVDANAFDYVGIPERSDAEKVAYEQENLTLIGNITENGEITLQVNGVTYESVLISWASNNACAVVEGGKLIVTLPEEATNVTITATLTCGGTTLTKEFTVLVDAAATAQYAPNFLTSAPVAGEYVFAMDQSAVEGYGILYATGEIGSKGQLLTTDKAHKAAKFVVAVVDGGYTIQFEGQYLEGYLNGTYKNLRYSDNACVWSWNDEAKVFTCNIDGTDYYFGTYLSNGVPKYDYMSLSAVSYITGSNASKIDESQFVGHVTTLVELVDKAFPVEAPVSGEFVFGMNQSAVEGYGWLYATGEIGSKGQLLTTDQLSKAAKFVITAVDGGYTIQFEGQYLEGYLNGTYKNLRYSDTEAIWAWNDEAKVFTCDIDGTAYYFGTYLSNGVPKYDYMSLSAVSYITGDNLSKIDASQFVGHLCEVKTVPANGGEEHEHVAGAEWLKDAENHWNVCECGEIMNKAAHDFSNGNCVCGQEAPAHTHAPEADYSYDADFHWNECACGEQLNKAAHDFANGDCVCGKEAPAVDNGDTVAEALAASEGQEVVITGIVTGIYQAYNSQYGNISVYVTDATGTILAFRLVGEWFVNDIITVTGKVTFYSGSNSNQIAAGCTAVKVGTHTCTEFAGGSCTVDSNCVECGATKAAPGHTYANGSCSVCGEAEPVGEVLPGNLIFTSAANKANADSYLKTNFPEWSITGKLGQTYGGYLGFGRSGDGTSAIKSSAITTTTGFTVKAVIKGNGSSGTMTSTLTFTLVDKDGNVVATGYANGSSTAAITPADAKDTTYNITFTFVEGKSWSDVSNLVVSFKKSVGNIGLKSLDFVK